MNLLKYITLVAFLGGATAVNLRKHHHPVPGVTFLETEPMVDPQVQEIQAQIKELQDQLDVLEGRVIEEKSEEEQAAILNAQVSALADKADADARKAEEAKLLGKIALLKKELEEGEEEPGTEGELQTNIDEKELALGDLQALIEKDENAAVLAQAAAASKEKEIADIKKSVADLQAKAAALNGEVQAAQETVAGAITEHAPASTDSAAANEAAAVKASLDAQAAEEDAAEAETEAEEAAAAPLDTAAEDAANEAADEEKAAAGDVVAEEPAPVKEVVISHNAGTIAACQAEGNTHSECEFLEAE